VADAARCRAGAKPRVTGGAELRIGIVAAEPSGDLLAAGLMAALRDQLPAVRFEGVSGPRMREVGIDQWASMDALSVMGLFEVVRHFPRLYRLRARLRERWRDTPPAAFIGVDAPDFNLGLERGLRAGGVPTVHYVSPTVWAWRTGRVRTIRRAVDLLLTIFPFETDFLARHGLPAHYVGHPLASRMPLQPDREGARRALGLDPGRPTLAVLPGSRKGEVGRLARPFVQTVAALRERVPGLQVVSPMVNEATRQQFVQALREHAGAGPVVVVLDDSRNALAAADVVLTASGTATFEALLSKRPMVVGYKVNSATYQLARALKLVKAEHFAMANLLAGERLAPEFIQHECEPDRLAPALARFFAEPALRDRVAQRYRDVHEQLVTDTDAEAARAVIALLRKRGRV
jgi:lipid-A-disaccharide synthase